MNGRVLQAGDVEKGNAAIPPETGYFNGYLFKEWDHDISNVQEDMIVTAIYEKTSGYTVTVSGGAITSNQKESYSYAEIVTVQAEESRNGGYFSGWYEGDTLVSDTPEYSFALTKSTSLLAKYEGEKEMIQEPNVRFSMGERNTLENGNQTVVMDVTWSVPEGYTFTGAGLLRTLDDGYKASLELENVDGTNIKKNSTKLTESSGTYEYTLTLGSASKVKNLNARAYLIVTDDVTGEVRTLYSDIVTSGDDTE